jgi:hypothetical protein
MKLELIGLDVSYRTNHHVDIIVGWTQLGIRLVPWPIAPTILLDTRSSSHVSGQVYYPSSSLDVSLALWSRATGSVDFEGPGSEVGATCSNGKRCHKFLQEPCMNSNNNIGPVRNFLVSNVICKGRENCHDRRGCELGV